MSNTKPQSDKIGALWAKTFQRDGQETSYYSGEVEINGVKTRIVVFANNKVDTKTGQVNDKWPDFVIKLARENGESAAQPAQAAPRPTQAPRPAPAKRPGLM